MILEPAVTDIRPFKAEDMIEIIETGIKEFGLDHLSAEDVRELAEAREKNGQCITGWVDDKICACGGIDIMWEGVGEVWIMMSPTVDSYGMRARIDALDIIRDGLDKLIEDNKLWRCQAWGRIGFDRAHTLFKHLGFKAEGLAKKYAPDGADCILYAKIRN